MLVTLKPCPHCGNRRASLVELPGGNSTVQCGVCKAQGPVGDASAALYGWNKRQPLAENVAHV